MRITKIGANHGPSEAMPSASKNKDALKFPKVVGFCHNDMEERLPHRGNRSKVSRSNIWQELGEIMTGKEVVIYVPCH